MATILIGENVKVVAKPVCNAPPLMTNNDLMMKTAMFYITATDFFSLYFDYD